MASAEMECSNCNSPFERNQTEVDLLPRFSLQAGEFSFSLPPSDLCPGCREQQRLCYRNEWNFYRRKCDASGKLLVSIYPEETPFDVYEQEYWWSDEFDPLHYGRDFDFSRGFFEQFRDLNLAVPKVAIQNAKSSNSAYTNYSAENKDCYLAIGTSYSRDTYYSYRVTGSVDICDSYDLQKSEFCYECVQSTDLYESAYCTNCHNCSNLFACENCRGCKNCIGCVNLNNASYHVFNTPCSPEEYRTKRNQLTSNLSALESRLRVLRQKELPPAQYLVGCENSEGDQLYHCSNCIRCFTLKECQDCAWCGTGESNRDSLDSNFFDGNELQYFSTNLHENYFVLFGALVWFVDHGTYLLNCFNSSNLFGCSGMKKHKYCILNKQYDKQEYEKMLRRIVEHMRGTGEWGKFFPPADSPFPYNCSVANEYYPLNKEDARAIGLKWEAEVAEKIESRKSEDQRVLTCEQSGKQFRVIPQEMKFYRRFSLELPKFAPLIRHQRRLGNARRTLRNQM